jgi:hypothetical protein
VTVTKWKLRKCVSFYFSLNAWMHYFILKQTITWFNSFPKRYEKQYWKNISPIVKQEPTDRYDKRWKTIFQPADPLILPENPQIPALSGEHLRDGLNLISQLLILSNVLILIYKNIKINKILSWVS